MKRQAAREVAVRVLREVELRGAFAEEMLGGVLPSQPIRAERALTTELVYGVLRWRGRLDWLLEQHSSLLVEDMTPWIRNILRVGAYQLCFLNRVPSHAAVDEAVKLARRYGHQGTAGLVNAVLRAVARGGKELRLPDDMDPVARLAVEYSHPTWLVARWVVRYGLEKARQILSASNQVPPVTIRVNSQAIDPGDLANRLRESGVEVAPCEYAPEGLRLNHGVAAGELAAFKEGLFQMQDEASMLVGYLTGVRPGMRALDCCAGSGIKTTHMAALMGNKGEIVATDIRLKKIRELRENCRRLGASSVRSLVADAAQALPLKGEFDTVLVDAPCSDLGVLRRHPEARWRKLEERLPELARVQVAILLNVARYVARGGALTYCTCSTESEENEAVVAKLLSEDAGFEVEDGGPFLPERARQFVDSSGYFRTLTGDGDMDGFFAVLLRRRS